MNKVDGSSDSDHDGSLGADDDNLDLLSSDEDEALKPGINNVSTAEEYKEIFINEEEVVENIANDVVTESDLSKKYSKYDTLADTVFKAPQYQDISPMFIDGSPFLIDGSSLITCIMKDENYDLNNGSQTLHCIYLCERIIELICRKGGVCEVMFFNDKSLIWQDIPAAYLMLSVLRIHLKKNTNITVHEMDSIFSKEFINYVEEVNPCFIMIDFTFAETFEDYLTAGKDAKLFRYYGLFALAVGLYAIDICYVELHNNLLFSFVLKQNLKYLMNSMRRDFTKYTNHCKNQNNKPKLSLNNKLYNLCNKNLKTYVALDVAEMLIKNKIFTEETNVEILKVFFLYYAVADCLPLSCRCFNSEKIISPKLENIINKIIQLINNCLQAEDINNLDCTLVCDLWQGNLFVEVIYCVKYFSVKSMCLGNKLERLYADFLDKFNELTGINLDKYPISFSIITEELSDITSPVGKKSFSDLKSDLFQKFKPSTELIADDFNQQFVTQPLNSVIESFCSDIIPSYYLSNLPEYFKNILKTNKAFEEKYHWHCLKPLSDDFERVRDNNKQMLSMPVYRQLREKAKFAHFMALYGSNVEGKPLEYEPIVVCEPQKETEKGSKKKQKKQNKVSSNAGKIIEKNKTKKQKELLEIEKKKFDLFLKAYKASKNGKSDRVNLSFINQTLIQLNSDEYIGKILYYKAEVLFQLWKEECKGSAGDREKNFNYLKELFLTIKKLLYCSKKVNFLTEKHNNKISKLLCDVGFSSIAEKWHLPIENEQSSIKLTIPANLSYIRFQLIHLGAELERKIEGEFDDRVSGFIPDPWQKKLFDIVDKGHSALIVAPTSSGKTYASYYCMKKVLKESNDGRIVYVAPTKALVNQVAATVYARFKNKNMPPGMSVYGVFTRDYKHYACDCQILVTVPECLELLLMSPRHYSWAKSLKYVIFDEVHCLGGQSGGIFWERCLMLIQCPFLALSATVQNPEEFWMWMQHTENYKKSLNPNLGKPVHLVIHTERHNDLIRHIYTEDGKLQHIHPYAHLTKHVLQVHKGIPEHLSLAPSEIVELYDTMCLVSPDDPELIALNPDTYFSNTETGFLFRQDVKKYELKLKSVMAKWCKENYELFQHTVEKLYEPLKKHESETKPYTYFAKSIVPFIETLQSKEMLPAIIFSYNRGYCETIVEDLAKHFRVKENEALSQKKSKSQFQVQDYDDYIDDRDEEFIKNKKIKSTSGKKSERLKREVKDLFPLGLNRCSLEFSVKGKHNVDNKDLQYIEYKLKRRFNRNDLEIDELRRGLGVHHGGITTSLRQSVEMLFRSKFLNVVFATGTLALGIHMPCKTVVILADSTFLNTLEYHQMSGRSGRRGFDKTGDVIFYGLDTRKMRVLMTSKLPRMNGNFPLTVSTVLRVLLLITDVTDKKQKTEESYNATHIKAITVLSQGLLYQTEKRLVDQMKHFVLFSCHLLMIQGLVDATCQPTLLTGFATHLHYHEPGNLAFVYLLRSGVLAKLCKSKSTDGKVSSETCEIVVNLMCRLFTRIPLIPKILEKDLKNSVVKLPPLPDFVTKALESYNDDVKTVYRCYFEGFAKHVVGSMGEDNKLPLSGKVIEGAYSLEELKSIHDSKNPALETFIARRSNENLICSAFAGLSGQTDENLYCQNSLISNIRQQVFTDAKVIPIIDLETPLNGYAFDFYRHGVLKSIVEDNTLSSDLHPAIFICLGCLKKLGS
ncbi:putative ATP-dependent RNA helicase DDX60 isoform X2 [Lycorma delicatula]|uniref:putative ATP-dependent RNA helicase DDX60 isoform X2 n=1 Tax=Lycorma delicatula TaxID=130591 RepID=UPI003F517E73